MKAQIADAIICAGLYNCVVYANVRRLINYMMYKCGHVDKHMYYHDTHIHMCNTNRYSARAAPDYTIV